MNGKGVRGMAAAIAALVAVGFSCVRDDQPQAWREHEEEAARVAAGQRLFDAYCSSCHGTSAQGNGPAAGALRTKPADLTRIAERAGGTFEAAKVATFIDGRTRIEAHGDREMPVWGRLYDDRNDKIMSDETLLSPGMIFDLVEYLKTIQVTAGTARPG